VGDPNHPGTAIVQDEPAAGPVAVVATMHEARDAVALVGAHRPEAEALAHRALEGEGIAVEWTGSSPSGRARYLGVDGAEVHRALRRVHHALFEPKAQ